MQRKTWPNRPQLLIPTRKRDEARQTEWSIWGTTECGADGTCTGPRPSPGMYFSPIVSFNIVWSDFVATSPSNGTWHQSQYGDFGDITG